jgi:hypothetical protein
VLTLCSGESGSVGLGGMVDLYAGGRFDEVEARWTAELGYSGLSTFDGLAVRADRDS